MSSLSSARKSISEIIRATKSHELWERKFEYAAQILLLTDFQAKERLLAVCMSFRVCKLFCCFLTSWIEGTILLAIMNSLLRCLHVCGIDSGVNNVQVWQTVQVLYFGPREHLFIYLFIFYTFVKLCGCQCIWDLKFEEYGEECDQLSDIHVIVHTTSILICSF